jgi:hypothetical protein
MIRYVVEEVVVEAQPGVYGGLEATGPRAAHKLSDANVSS